MSEVKRCIVSALFLTVCLCSCNFIVLPDEDALAGNRSVSTGEANVERDNVYSAANNSGDYYMITFSSGVQYWAGCFEGMQRAAEELGVNAIYTGAAEADYVEETQVLEQVIAKKPAGILISPVNGDAMKDVIDRTYNAGIPIICFDSDSAGSNRYSFVGTESRTAGAAAAKEMAEAIGHKGYVAVVLFPGLMNQEERNIGFTEYMRENEPDITVLESVNGGQNENDSAAATLSLISAHPEIDGIFAVTGWTGLGAGQAIEEAGRADDICCICFDTDEGVLDYIEKGVLYGTCAQGTQQMGYWGLQFLYAINNQSVVPGWQEKNISPVPTKLDTGVTIVKKGYTESYR